MALFHRVPGTSDGTLSPGQISVYSMSGATHSRHFSRLMFAVNFAHS